MVMGGSPFWKNREAEFSADLTDGRSHCACGTRSRFVFFMPLLGAPQEVAEEGRPGVPPGNPLGIRRGVAASGCLYRKALGKGVAFPFLFEICADRRA